MWGSMNSSIAYCVNRIEKDRGNDADKSKATIDYAH